MPDDAAVLDYLRQLADEHRAAEPQAAGPYRAGEITRLNKTWLPQSYSGDQALGEAWELATRRIRDLDRNDPAMQSLERALVDHTIGPGILTTGDVQIVDGPPDEEEYNDEVDTLVEQWEAEAEADGPDAWGDLQREVMREMLATGDGLLLRVQLDDPGRLVPLAYQALEAEQLDESMDRPAAEGQNAIRRGIEIGPNNRPVAYHLFDTHPSDPYAINPSRSRRIPAERVIHISNPGRPSQTRGQSLYAGIVQSARDLDRYLGDELTAATIASLLTVVWKTDTHTNTSGLGFAGDGSSTATADQYGNPIVRLGHGIVCKIPTTDEVKPIEQNRPNSQAKTFVDLILMLLGMGGNVSRYAFCRDFSGITYIAARAAMIHDEIGHRPLQRYFWRRVCRPVHLELLAQLVARGKIRTISAQQYANQRRRWSQAEPLFPAIPLLDTEKETDAILGQLGAGLVTLKEACGRLGKAWRRVLRQRAREDQYAAGLGLALDFGRPSKPPAPARADQPAGGED